MPSQTRVTYEELCQPNEDCLCGRKMGELHCPFDGTATVRAVISRTHDVVLPNGNILENRIWCCRKCGRYFGCSDRLACSAPAPRSGRPSKKEQKASEQPNVKFGSLDDAPPELAKIVRELQKKRGIEP